MNTAYAMYQQNDVMTSNPLKLVILLYDAAMGNLSKAVEAAEAGDVKNKNIYANSALDIVTELNEALNVDQGGELASSLRRIYFFINRHTMKSNWGNDIHGFRDAIRLLGVLREAWQHIYDEMHELPMQHPQPAYAYVGLRA